MHCILYSRGLDWGWGWSFLSNPCLLWAYHRWSVQHLVYLDTFLPRDGQSLYDLGGVALVSLREDLTGPIRPALAVLTIGATIPKLALHPDGGRLRECAKA